LDRQAVQLLFERAARLIEAIVGPFKLALERFYLRLELRPPGVDRFELPLMLLVESVDLGLSVALLHLSLMDLLLRVLFLLNLRGSGTCALLRQVL